MSIPNHLAIALKEMGTSEVDGVGNNPKIVQYHAATSLKAMVDSVSWCSSFVNWVMQQARLPSTHSAAARSWLYYGEETKNPKQGDIVVLWRDDPKSMSGHVGFYMEHDQFSVSVLGGNQNNKVCISKFPLNRVLSYRTWNAASKNT